MLAHRDDAGGAGGVTYDHGPIATFVRPHLHHLIRAANARCGARGAKLLFQLLLHLLGGRTQNVCDGVGGDGAGQKGYEGCCSYHIPNVTLL